MQETWVWSLGWEDPRERLPTPVFWPGKFCGLHSPWGHKESDMTEWIHFTLLRPTWLCIPGCLALGEWSHHHGYLGHTDLFLYSTSLYSCHFLISSASVRSLPFLSFIEPICAWNDPLVCLIFLKRSQVFPILLFSSISLHFSLRKAFLSLLAILWNSAFKWVYLSFSPLPFTSLLFIAMCKASSDNHFAFLHFIFLGMVLITDSCTMSQTSVHSSSGTLSDLIPWIYLSL